MKRIIALLLVLVTLGAIVISCGPLATKTSDTEEPTVSGEASVSGGETSALPNTDSTSTPESAEPSGDKNSEVEIDPEKQTHPFKQGLYTITTADGKELCWNARTIGPKAGKTGDIWEETVWYIMNTTKNNGKETVSHIYAGDLVELVMYTNIVKPDGEVTLKERDYSKVVEKQAWYIRDNGDGTFKIVSSANPKFALNYKDGSFLLAEVETASSFKIEETENKSTAYAQWMSEKGNISVRLPVDVVNQVYDRVKKISTIKDEAKLKAEIEATMQRFAENSQHTYDSLIELTAFTPYPHIIIKAYEHQGVMAGVVGNNCNIFVNVDWYVDDMEKMYLRWEQSKQNDFNFCTLHEMGHMFDWDRGWTFESEMQTDLKASYVLWDNQGVENGAWGAPAEYDWRKCFDINTIDVGADRWNAGGYQGLSATMAYNVDDNGELVSFSYSIYRSAQMYVSYVKYCEKTEGLKGFEGLREAFHWYQDNGKTASSYKDGAERLHTFNAKLEEFMGLNVEKYMLDNSIEKIKNKGTWSEADWYATIANQEQGDKRLK